MRRGMRIASGLMAALFVWAAVLQLNDPDPLRWILAYLVAALISAAVAFGRASVLASAVAAIVFASWFLALAPTLLGAESDAFTSFRMKESQHEQPREAIGLALCALWCGVLAVWGAKGRPGERKPDEPT